MFGMYVFTALSSDPEESSFGEVSNSALTLRINVVTKPYITMFYVSEGTQSGVDDESINGELVVGENIIEVPARSFARGVKFKFDDNHFTFDSLTLNGADPGCSYASN